MSEQDIVFNGKTFVENVEIYGEGTNPIIKLGPVDTTVARTVLNATLAPGNIETFLTSYNKTNEPFSSWDKFLEAAVGTDAAKKTAILDGFVSSYRTILNMGDGGPNDPPAGEWSGLVTALENLQPPTDPPRTINVGKHFIDSFESFLYNYNYNSSGGVTDANEFFNNWATFMAVTAQIDDSTDNANRNSTTVDVNAFEQIYVAFGFDLTKFDERLAEFYVKHTKVSEGGSPYFIPSHAFDEWFEEMRSDFIHKNFVSTVDTQTASQLLVIDRILRLLISMIDVLQRISAVQANRLSFLTEWQRAYTDQLTDVPQYTAGDGTPLESNATHAKNWRSDVNSRMQSVTEKIRAWRGEVQDQAKALQSSINASQDAANQQTQMATSLLQQLSTILAQIFR
jgi:hypothetical protein